MRYIDQFIRKGVIDINKCIHGGRIAEFDPKNGTKLMDFSANFNPICLPNNGSIEEITIEALKDIEFYPDNRYLEFKSAAARFAGVDPKNIIPANGSSELIRLVAETILDSGDAVIVPQPTFEEYETSIRLMGAVPENIKYREIYHDPEKISDESLNRAKALFICNPNNPTGTLIGKPEMEKLALRCQRNETFLVVDEAFIELSEPTCSIAGSVNKNPFVIVMRSLTKVFAIPGLRTGYAVAHADLASRMDNIRIPWNLGTIPEAVGTWLLNTYSADPTFLERSRQLIRIEREWLTQRLSLIRGFKPIPSDSNFILIRIRDFGMDSKDITQRMLDQGILIRDCESFKELGRDYIRVAVKTRKENQKLIDAFSMSVTHWGRELAEKEIDEALLKGKISSRTNCEYYPCHFEDQDCTFCFCPFYPCEDERTGGELINRSTGGKVWSCSGCDLVHRPETANAVLEALMACNGKPDDIRRIWKKLIESLL